MNTIVSIFSTLLCSLILSCHEDPIADNRHTVTAGALRDTVIATKPSSVVVFLSPTCSGKNECYAHLRKQAQALKDSTNFVIVGQCTPEHYSILQSDLNSASISCDTLLYINNNTYRNSVFNPKGRYDEFLTELCQDCNDKSLGYPLVLYYKGKELVGRSYFLKDSLWHKIVSQP